MVERDYLADMDAAITEAMGTGDVIASVAAQKLHARLSETDPDLLSGWLAVNAVHFLAETIGDQDRHQRSRTRASAKAREFGEAAEQGGQALSVFAVRYVVDGNFTRRPLGQMTGADHRYVAEGFRADAARARMLASFHSAIAAKIGDRTTSEVMSEAEYQRLYKSIMKGRRPE